MLVQYLGQVNAVIRAAAASTNSLYYWRESRSADMICIFGYRQRSFTSEGKY